MNKETGVKLQTPFTMIICGQTQSGKSSFCRRLLKLWQTTVDKSYDYVLWLYGQNQNTLFNDLQSEIPVNIEFAEGFNPDYIDNWVNHHPNCVIVVDDLNRQAFSNDYFATLFDGASHHKRANVIAISQNCYDRGTQYRQAMLNTRYLVLLSSARDKRVLSHINSQIFPNYKGLLSDVYSKVIESAPYEHILIDLSPYVQPELRLRSSIFDQPVFHVHQSYYPKPFDISETNLY